MPLIKCMGGGSNALDSVNVLAANATFTATKKCIVVLTVIHLGTGSASASTTGTVLESYGALNEGSFTNLNKGLSITVTTSHATLTAAIELDVGETITPNHSAIAYVIK